MDTNMQSTLKERYLAATESFINKVKTDPNVIAVIICGSLAYDQVWEKSDIDMTVVVRDQIIKNDSYCIIEDDITINVGIAPRSSFKRYMERTTGGTFMQAYFAKGQIVYSTDDSFNDYFEELRVIGRDDRALSILYDACNLLYCSEKATKWLTVKKDPVYAQFYLLGAAESLARIEVTLQGDPPTREVIQQALKINPELITPYYQNAMSRLYTEEEIQALIEGINAYMIKHLDVIKQPVLEYMKDQELKTVTMLAKYFHTEGHHIISLLDYLADQGVLMKVSQTIRITPRGKKAVEEIGYLYIPPNN